MKARSFIAVVIALVICSCGNTRYVPVESVRLQSVNTEAEAIEKAFSHILDRLRSTERTSDSVRTIEKIHIVVNEQGDTIRADRETSSSRTSIRERELERLLQSRDSTISALRLQVDSILSESTPRIIEVERKLSRWEQTKMDLGGIALGAVAVALSIAVVWLIKKFRR